MTYIVAFKVGHIKSTIGGLAMTNAKLKEHFTNQIINHFGREMWRNYPERTYDDSVGPFIEQLIKIASYHKRDKALTLREYDEDESFAATTTDGRIGKKIREVRLKKGWTIARLAKAIDVDIDYLKNLERGEPLMQMWVLERIVVALKIKSSAILPF
jgi:DNA-binding XRE family transcriptional regulator